MSSSDQRALHLVDDDPAVRRSVGFMLKTSGYQVQSYETGVDLLRAAGDLANGCVLPDIRMPGMDGLDVQEMLQQKGVTLPVVIMTGHRDVALAVRAMKAGVVDFVEKPFKKATLLSSLEEGFNRRSRKEVSGERRRDAEVRLQVLTRRERDRARRPRAWPTEQNDRLRPRHQPAYGRNSSRESHDQAWRQQLVGGASDRLRCSERMIRADRRAWISAP
jgi:two-component system, LuxR family, response regulator FixJ